MDLAPLGRGAAAHRFQPDLFAADSEASMVNLRAGQQIANPLAAGVPRRPLARRWRAAPAKLAASA